MRRLAIFISSPGDLPAERETAIRVIHRINELPFIRSRFSLSPLAWEKSVPALIGKPPQVTVNEYLAESARADIYICFLWKRMGTPVTDPVSGEQFQSGTEYEF